jgi:hypothetical protein
MNENLWVLIIVVSILLSVLAAMSWSFFMSGHEDEDIALDQDNYHRSVTAIDKGGERFEQTTTDPHDGEFDAADFSKQLDGMKKQLPLATVTA